MPKSKHLSYTHRHTNQRHPTWPQHQPQVNNRFCKQINLIVILIVILIDVSLVDCITVGIDHPIAQDFEVHRLKSRHDKEILFSGLLFQRVHGFAHI